MGTLSAPAAQSDGGGRFGFLGFRVSGLGFRNIGRAMMRLFLGLRVEG